MIVARLAEDHHIALLLQLLDDIRHHFNGKTVVEVAQDKADQIGGIGAKVSGGDVMYIAKFLDGRVDFFDGGVGDLSFLA